jgi:hypothetical protein
VLEESVPQRSIVSTLMSFWSRGQRSERAAYITAALLTISGVIHLGILVITGASWAGPLSLRKPATFGLSFGVTLATVAWVSSFLRLGDRARAIVLGGFTVASALETALVSLQAWRGVPSHFNVETALDAWVARMLAAGGVALVAVIVALTFASFRRRPGIPISLRVAIQIGFVALIGSVATGAFMIARGMMLVFAGDPQAAYWTGGALKPTHAVTMHGILLIPGLAWLLSFVSWTEQRRLGAVLLAAIGYVVVAAVVTVGNVNGFEPRQAPATAVALFGLGALVLLAIGVLGLNALTRSPNTSGIQHP